MENFKISKIETTKGLEKNNESKVEQNEKMRESKIVLHFMRHGKPESLQEGSTDEERHLSDAGVQQALGESENNDMGQSVAYGSPRVRSQETAAYVMAGNIIPETTTSKEVNEFLNQDLKVGSKFGVMEELNFSGGSPEFSKESDKAYTEGRYLDFIIKESDSLAERLGDKEATTLSVQAGNIAEIVKKYVEASPRWNKLVNSPEKNYEENLDRFLGSHQGVIESFLYKIVSDNKTKADLIANSLSSKGGFDFVEGITVDIIQENSSEQPKIVLEYSKENQDGLNFNLKETIPMEKIEKIIQEKYDHLLKTEKVEMPQMNEELKEHFRKQVSKLETELGIKDIKLEFIINGTKTKEDLIAEMESQDIVIPDPVVKNMFDSEKYTKSEPTIEPVVILSLPYEVRKNVLSNPAKYGLKLCPPDLGPNLRLSYKNQPIGEFLEVQMNQLSDDVGYLSTGKWCLNNYPLDSARLSSRLLLSDIASPHPDDRGDWITYKYAFLLDKEN